MNSNQDQLEFIVRSKEQYREAARAQSWEEKVASVQRMRSAGKLARESMEAAKQVPVLKGAKV